MPGSLSPRGPGPDLRRVPGTSREGELLRVTVGSDAHGHPAVVPDPKATAPGRGAHLHPTTECYELAVRRQGVRPGPALRGHGTGLSSTPLGEYLDSPTDQPFDRQKLEQQLMSTR